MPRPRNPDPGQALHAARELLNAWARQPVSRWLALAAGFEACIDERAAADGVLDSLAPACASPFDDWLVRDLADTAWHMAPRDITRIPDAAAQHARHLVVHMALANLSRAARDECGNPAQTSHRVA